MAKRSVGQFPKTVSPACYTAPPPLRAPHPRSRPIPSIYTRVLQKRCTIILLLKGPCSRSSTDDSYERGSTFFFYAKNRFLKLRCFLTKNRRDLISFIFSQNRFFFIHTYYYYYYYYCRQLIDCSPRVCCAFSNQFFWGGGVGVY